MHSMVRVADSIDDPVRRLRFLRTLAPETSTGRGRRHRLRQWTVGALLPLVFVVPFWIQLRATRAPVLPARPVSLALAAHPPAQHAENVWQIETSGNSEAYSNGLRISTEYTVTTQPRAYYAFTSQRSSGKPVARFDPAGIVFHTTESCQAPFDAAETAVIKRLGRELLEFVRRNRSYHYVIDRFGRVFRVVAEPDVAFHAGHSVWADSDWLYIDLNRSFLGISFEAQSAAGQDARAEAAQIRAAGMLTEMLRSRYHIPAENCVTHAQVSVNPSNMRIGYHTDWFSNFPFRAVGLPDNYAQPLPSLWACGFGYDPRWLEAGSRMEKGVETAELEILRGAAAAGMQPEPYRKTLQRRYRECLAQARLTPVAAPPADSHSAASPAGPPPPIPAAHRRTRPRALAER